MLGLLARIALQPFGLELRRSKKSDPFWVQSQLIEKADPLIFDIGAAIGDISAKYRKLFPKCTLHAFEPFPEACRRLEQRFRGCSWFLLNQVAVGELDGLASFTSNVSPCTNSLLRTDPQAAESWGEGILDTKTELKVPVTTIDSYCQKNGVNFIDILKLDIQGGELNALRGAKALLREGRIGLVFLEIIHARTYVGQPRFEEYLQLFREAGYTMLDIFNTNWKGVQLLQSDAIFVRDRTFTKDERTTPGRRP